MRKAEFEIAKLPIPSHARGGLAPFDYPWFELNIGQCIVVAFSKRSHLAKKALKFMAANPGWNFEGHYIGDKERYGFWCTARPDPCEGEDSHAMSTAELLPHTESIQSKSAVPPIRRDLQPITTSDTVNKLREAAKLTKPGTRTVVRK